MLDEHYAHIADKPFFPNRGFMSRTPVVALALEGEDAVSSSARAARSDGLPARPKRAPSAAILAKMSW